MKKPFMKLYLFLCIACVFKVNASDTRIKYTADGQIEEAFVTFATANYFPLVEILLDSMKVFSTRGIVVFGVNADVPFSTEKYPFMIKKRIDVPVLSMMEICAAKPKVILESGIIRGVYVDADAILNKGCDILFSKVKEVQYPVCCIFPWLVDNMHGFMDVMGVPEKSMPYVHAPLIMFHKKCFPFIEEWYRTCVTPEYQPLLPCHDETVLNVLLWKYRINDYINLCDPYYSLANDYIFGTIDNHVAHGYRNWIGKIDFYVFHGGKDVRECREILNRLINHHQKKK